MAQGEAKMEGWLYLIRLNMIGFQYSRKRYFILDDHCLKSFRSIPVTKDVEPLRSAIIDLCIRVTDNGRKSCHRKAFFIFTLYNTSDHNDQLKLGASSPEEAARWIQSLQEVALKPGKNIEAPCKRNYQPFRLSMSGRALRKNSIDWTCNKSRLRLFKESKDKGSNRELWGDHPAIMAVGVVHGSSEAIFRTLMSLGPSRSKWDYCFYRGSIVEHLDGHTDIIYIQLYKHWMPWGLKRRYMLLRRYWRRESDGTYGGGYVVSPTKTDNQSVVKHMLAVDWNEWRSYIRKSSARTITIRALGKLSALIELFRAQAENYYSHELPAGVIVRDIDILQSDKEEQQMKTKMMDPTMTEERIEQSPGGGLNKLLLSGSSNLSELDDASDEFYAVPDTSDHDQSDKEWSFKGSPEMYFKDSSQQRSSTAKIVKKLHELACVQKKGGYMELNENGREDNVSSCHRSTLPEDSTCNMPCSYAAGDASLFLILETIISKIKRRSDKREDDLGSRPGGIVQEYAVKGRPEFFFIVNIQVPGSTTYNLAFYYMLTKPLEETPLLDRFVNGDDAFRNSRFKLIPYISEGSWIVKQSVGKKACLVGQALEVRYCRGNNYLEVDIDVGSPTIAKGVVSLVLGYLSSLVIELAFLIQAETEEELPEVLLGTCRLNHLEADSIYPS